LIVTASASLAALKVLSFDTFVAGGAKYLLVIVPSVVHSGL